MGLSSVIWDGHDLTDYFVVSGIERPSPKARIETLKAPGMDGTVVRSSTWAELTVSMTVSSFAHGHAKRRDDLRRLIGWLDVDGARRLQFADDGGLYYEAVPSGGGSRTDWIDADSVELEFLVTSPAMYGARHEVTVPSGGAVSFEVGGTYPTWPTIEAAAAVRGTSDLWGVRLDGGDYIRLKFASNTARAVSIDCETRESRVAGALALPTLSSDWLRLTPGRHTIAMDVGTGAATIAWDERWL